MYFVKELNDSLIAMEMKKKKKKVMMADKFLMQVCNIVGFVFQVTP